MADELTAETIARMTAEAASVKWVTLASEDALKILAAARRAQAAEAERDQLRARVAELEEQIKLMVEGACPTCVVESKGPGGCDYCARALAEDDAYAEGK
jgi:hypothetical protein